LQEDNENSWMAKHYGEIHRKEGSQLLELQKINFNNENELLFAFNLTVRPS